MTEKLYDENSYLREFTATVLDSYEKADGYFTVLDKTAFFPEGGGQPSDTGYLDGVRVYDVQINDGVVYHYTEKQLLKGQVVKGRLDFERRFDFMQQHSAEHIVSGVAHKLYGCENVGFHLSGDIVTLDFDKPLKSDEISQIELLANEAVYKNAQIKCYYPLLEQLKGIEYRSKKEIQGDIRIVEIEGVDACACCAPHVKATGEIGLIKLLSSESLRGGVRLEMKAGKRALVDYCLKQAEVNKVSSELCVKQLEIGEAVVRFKKEISELKFKLNGLKRQSLEKKIEEFSDTRTISAIFEDELEIKDLQYFADALYKRLGGIRAALSPKDNGFSFAVCGGDELEKFFLEFKSRFKVKGGGRNGMVQGTVEAVREEIELFLNELLKTEV